MKIPWLMSIKWPYEDRGGCLFVEDVSSRELAANYGTPLYVYSENRMRSNYRRLKAALEKGYHRVRVLYAMKANSNLAVLKTLLEEGAEVDAVSPGEVHLALQVGYKPEQILFTGTSVGYEELQYLMDKGVRMNLDSGSQLDKVLSIATPELISVRVNPQLGAGHHEHVITAGPEVKFGVWDAAAVDIYRRAEEAGVKRFGIHMHIGSGIHDASHHIRAAESMLLTAKRVSEASGVRFEFIDFGGGIGVPYRPEEDEIDIELFADQITGYFVGRVDELGLGEPELWLEPGRFITADAGILLTRVTTLKETPAKRFVGVDAGFNILLRPTIYGSYHHIVNSGNLGGPMQSYEVYGPLCESGDVFARDRSIQETVEGDVLAIMTVGAYGYSMSSQYNSRPRPAEVMVNKGSARLVRKKETFQDL
jgi:diaminopimelate decarboxylase